jgi:hypothetical protein
MFEAIQNQNTKTNYHKKNDKAMISYYKINVFPNYEWPRLILAKDKQSGLIWQEFRCTIGLVASNFQYQAHLIYFSYELSYTIQRKCTVL